MFNFVISMFQYFHPSSWRKSEQNYVRINSFPDVIVAACIGALRCVKHQLWGCIRSIIIRGPTAWVRLSVRHTQMRSSLLRKYTMQHRDGGAQHGGTIAQSTTWVTTRECDKDSDIGDDYK
jgi:hypothetical protein